MRAALWPPGRATARRSWCGGPRDALTRIPNANARLCALALARCGVSGCAGRAGALGVVNVLDVACWPHWRARCAGCGERAGHAGALDVVHVLGVACWAR